jgi:hypothetical protein
LKAIGLLHDYVTDFAGDFIKHNGIFISLRINHLRGWFHWKIDKAGQI